MKPIAACCTLFLVVFCASQILGTEPETPLSSVIESQGAGGKEQPKSPDQAIDKDKKTPEKKQADPPQTDLFNQANTNSPSTEAAGDFNPNMIGDFPGSFGRVTFTVFGFQTMKTTVTNNIIQQGTGIVLATTTQTTTTRTPVTQTRTILVPASSSASGFKVAENESPRPQDRVYVTWNYFGNIHSPQRGGGPVDTSQANTSIATANNPAVILQQITTKSVNTVFPASPLVTANLNREIFGFEKTFLDGNASVELRVPLLQQTSTTPGFGTNDVGDLTVITKYAFINDRQSGNVLSTGLAVTAPTGRSILTTDGVIRSTLLQPWAGYIWNADQFFVHAFHSVVVPTDARDVTLLFNDVGLNYWLYRGDSNRLVSSVVPMIEAHVTTPLNHRDLNGPIFVPDLVVLTGGVNIGLFRSATLSLGVATPVTGPRIFSIETMMQLNWRF